MIKLAIIGLGKWGQELVKSVNSKLCDLSNPLTSSQKSLLSDAFF